VDIRSLKAYASIRPFWLKTEGIHIRTQICRRERPRSALVKHDELGPIPIAQPQVGSRLGQR
jgi:hypothetical protein